MKETLSEYTKRLMDEKNYGVRDVARNSKGKISASHVSKILSGEAENLTASKSVGLALGLGVDPHEVFSIITGFPIPEAKPEGMIAFVDVVRKIMDNPKLIEVIQLWAKLPAKEERVLLRTLQYGKRPRSKTKKR
jgi:transcriptional regulator with XRE-family HTH domain